MRTCCRPSWRQPATLTSSTPASQGHTVGDKTYKVHLDGYNLMPAFEGCA